MIVGYLTLFYGFQAFKSLEKKRADYQQLVTLEQELQTDILTAV